MAFGSLNRLFTEHTLEALAKEGAHPAFSSAVHQYLGNNAKGVSNGEALSELYRHMSKNYRNEYVYKSTLLKKLVFGIHSPRTSTAICELPVAGSIADFVIINGRAVVYEIKTELDNFSRLDSQLADYYKAFSHVNILCPESASETLCEMYDGTPVGVCALTRRGCISVRKACQESTEALDRAVQFDLLRKYEREQILTRCGSGLPDTTAALYYRACLEKFKRIPEDEFASEFAHALKRRGSKIDLAALEDYPEEFKLVAYTHRATKSQAQRLATFLKAPCHV